MSVRVRPNKIIIKFKFSSVDWCSWNQSSSSHWCINYEESFLQTDKYYLIENFDSFSMGGLTRKKNLRNN